MFTTRFEAWVRRRAEALIAAIGRVPLTPNQVTVVGLLLTFAAAVLVAFGELRWVLDRSEGNIALWGARRPDQLAPLKQVIGWHIDAAGLAEIDRILSDTITNPVGPEFMAPPERIAA